MVQLPGGVQVPYRATNIGLDRSGPDDNGYSEIAAACRGNTIDIEAALQWFADECAEGLFVDGHPGLNWLDVSTSGRISAAMSVAKVAFTAAMRRDAR